MKKFIGLIHPYFGSGGYEIWLYKQQLEYMKNNIYHADNISQVEFLAQYSIRVNEFNNIIKSIENQNSRKLQQYLLVGKRGMGKSTLLRRIEIELLEERHKNRYITIRLSDEHYSVSRLYKLWEKVVNRINANQLNQQIQSIDNTPDYENHLADILGAYLLDSKKSLILLIDNFDNIAKKLTKTEQQQFREILIKYPIQIIGTTLLYDDFFINYKAPFFDFFKIVQLKNLSIDEARVFIEGRKSNNFLIEEFQLNTLLTLSGGVPRTLVFLLKVIESKRMDDSFAYLQELLELVTPLYQDRMRQLSPQQMEIMLCLAKQYEKTEVKQISEQTRIESKSISAQLKVLELNGYVEKVAKDKKNWLYFIDERFFNIWLLLSEGDKRDEQRMIWLAKCLDELYEAEELDAYFKDAQQHTYLCYNKYLITQALIQSKKLSDEIKLGGLQRLYEENELDEAMRTWVNEKINYFTDKVAIEKTTEILKELETLKGMEREQFIKAWYSKGLFTDYYMGIYYLEERKDKQTSRYYFEREIQYGEQKIKAAEELDKIYSQNELDYSEAIKHIKKTASEQTPIDYYRLALFYYRINDKMKALKYYKLASDNNILQASFKAGLILLENFGDSTTALQYFEMAARNNNANSFHWIGRIQLNNNNLEEAEINFKKAIQLGWKGAYYYLADVYKKQGKFEDAISCYEKLNDEGNAKVYTKLLYLYTDTGNYKKAKELIKRNSTSEIEYASDILLVQIEMNKKDEETDVLIETLNNNNTGFESDSILTIAYLWLARYEQYEEKIASILKQINLHEDDGKEMNVELLIPYLIIFKQFNLAYKIFNLIPILQEKYILFWNALIIEMNKQDKNLTSKILPELEEPLRRFSSNIAALRNKYSI